MEKFPNPGNPVSATKELYFDSCDTTLLHDR